MQLRQSHMIHMWYYARELELDSKDVGHLIAYDENYRVLWAISKAIFIKTGYKIISNNKFFTIAEKHRVLKFAISLGDIMKRPDTHEYCKEACIVYTDSFIVKVYMTSSKIIFLYRFHMQHINLFSIVQNLSNPNLIDDVAEHIKPFAKGSKT